MILNRNVLPSSSSSTCSMCDVHDITIILKTGVRLTIISKMFGLMCWELVSSVVIQEWVGILPI